MNRLPVPKKIAGVHSTTVPCEPNTANRHKEKPNIFEKSIPVLTTLCMVGLELLAQGGGELPYKNGGDACRGISDEPLKGTNLGVA